MDSLREIIKRRAAAQRMKKRQEDDSEYEHVKEKLPPNREPAQLEKLKKKKSDQELAKGTDIYGKDLAWYDDDLEEKKKFKDKYKSLYERVKEKQG